MKKKFIQLFMVSTAIILALSACGSKTEPTPQAETPKAETPQAGESSSNTDLKPVDLTWYFPLPAVPADMKSVEDAVNAITKEKINATIHMKPQAFGDYTQKMNVVVASGEKADIIWTSNWNFDYGQNTAKGAFIPLDDLLQKYAPDVLKSMPDFVWQATKINGKTYGLPNYQTVTNREGFKVVKSYADKYGFDPSKMKKLEDIEPFLEAVKKAEPDKIPMVFSKKGKQGLAYRTFGLEAIANIGAVRINQDDSKVISLYESDEYKQYLDIVHRWYTKGLINEDASTIKNVADVFKGGKVVSDFHNVLSADTVANEKTRMGDIVLAPLTDYFASTGTIITTMQAISSTSDNPDRAMMFLNLVNTDKTLYNILVYGVEGKHYTKAGDVVTVNPDAGYNPNAAWVFGNIFNAYLTPNKDAQTVEQIRKDNESAKPSPLMGFQFNNESVSAEIAAVQSVIDEYGPGLDTGTVDPKAKLAEFQDKLKQAGIDKVIAEMQKQLDEWKKTK